MSLREQHRAFEKLLREYLEELRKRAQDPDATDEMSLRPALNVLVDGLPEDRDGTRRDDPADARD